MRPFANGEAALLTARLSGKQDIFKVALKAPDALEVTPPVRVAANREIFWRLKSKETGSQTIVLHTGERELSSAVQFGRSAGWIEPLVSSRWYWGLFYPMRGSPPDSAFGLEELSLSYAESRYKLLGFEMHWLFYFFIVSLAGGLAAAKVFKVEI